MQEDGKEKKVTEQYVVEAMSFTEAEARIIEEMSPYISETLDVVAEKIAPYNEAFVSDRAEDDKWFVVKVSFITLDEKTNKENKHSVRYLVQADSSEHALGYTKKMVSSGMGDYNIDAVQETPTLKLFLYEGKSEPVES